MFPSDEPIEPADGGRSNGCRPPCVPMSDEDIRAATVGEPTLHAAPVRLEEYDPAWPRLFEREAARVRAALGNRALRLEHVGTTSVPGLAAKPLIDMLLVVADSADE